MILSNITDRGTLRGVIYRGAGSGTTDYTQLSNKPQINGHTLQGNQSGDDLDLIDKGSVIINNITVEGNHTGDYYKLINDADLKFNEGWAGAILHNIKFKNTTYTVYASPFSGASSGGNGTMGLVPAPLSSQGDDNKYLKGNGTWSRITPQIDNLYQANDNSGAPLLTNINYNDNKNLSDYDIIYLYFTVTDSGDYSLMQCDSFLAKHRVKPIYRFTGYKERFINIEFNDTYFNVQSTAAPGEQDKYKYHLYSIFGIKF